MLCANICFDHFDELYISIGTQIQWKLLIVYGYCVYYGQVFLMLFYTIIAVCKRSEFTNMIVSL